MEAPETVDQALALAAEAANEQAGHERNLAAARAHFEMQRTSLAARRATMTADEIALAEDQLSEDAFEVECAQQALWNFAPEISVWESGYQFNDRGEDYTVSVVYAPLVFAYDVHYSDEHGERFCGSYQTKAEALARARVETYGYDDESELPQPPPPFSREESTKAGETVVHINGQAQSIKTFVDEALDRANLGCGQHYEIFARRAKDLLAQLPHHVADADERDALITYLAYDRF